MKGLSGGGNASGSRAGGCGSRVGFAERSERALAAVLPEQLGITRLGF